MHRPSRFLRLEIGILGAVLCLLVALPGCGGGGDQDRTAASTSGDHEFTPPTPASAAWERELVSYRAQVDAHFATEQGPLTDAQRAGFEHLEHYPLDPAYHFIVIPDKSESGQPISFYDTKGNTRYYTVHSRVHLQVSGVPITLTVYLSQTGDYLFLPFQDETTGAETYEVGRYLELRERPDGALKVDFNLAKNPYCAYSDRWACPTVPATNRLEIAIRAGEKGWVH